MRRMTVFGTKGHGSPGSVGPLISVKRIWQLGGLHVG